MNTASAKDIFLDALELPPERQNEFVHGACGGDDALRAKVEGLLRTHRSRPGLLDRPAADLDASWSGVNGPSAPHVRPEQPGDVIDRYQLIRLIGEGGFGSVFLAQQTEPLVREVALKVIRRGMDTEQVIARFSVERQALAMMDHPGIARVLDAGATASGRPYFVMEYVAGVPITQYCEQHKLSISDRLELIEQACLAVQHAHQKGIIHRDLKPGNILVTCVDDRPMPKIIDFGVAKAIDPSTATPSGSFSAAPVTMEAQIIGTPQYMSPEQATGSAARIDTRTDVYSLGTVLYELITGAPPFDPQMLRSAPLGGVGQMIRDQTPAKPSRRIDEMRRTETHSGATSVLSYRRQFPNEIDWIIMKALEKEPARRYQSATELAADIRRHLSDQAVLAGPPSRLYAARKFASRHRASIAAAAVVAMTLVAMTITSAVLATRARRAEATARREAQRAEEQLARANAIVGFTGDLLGGIGPSVARGRDTALLHEILDDSIRKAQSNLAGQPSVELAVRNLIGNALNDLGDPAAALAQLRPLYDATANSPLRDHPERLRAAVLMANILFMRNEITQAGKLVEEALDGYRRIGMEESEDGYKARIAQACADLFTPNRAGIAEKRLAGILAHYRATGQGESETALHVWDNLALAISGQGRWDEACEMWRQLSVVQRRLYGDDHPYTLETFISVGNALTELQRLDEAEKVLRDTLAIARRIYPPGHPTLLVSMNNLAGVFLKLNKFDDADAVLTEALETGRKKLGPLDQPMDTIILQLGELRAKQKRFDDAVKYANDLYDAVAARFGQRHIRTLSALVLVYDNLLQANRAAEGVAIVEKIGELPSEVTPHLRQQLYTRAGRLYLANGNEPMARRYAQLARTWVQKDKAGKENVPASLRVLERDLHIRPPTSEPTTTASN